MAILSISAKPPDPPSQGIDKSTGRTFALFHGHFTEVKTSLSEMELLSISDAIVGQRLKLDLYTLKQK